MGVIPRQYLIEENNTKILGNVALNSFLEITKEKNSKVATKSKPYKVTPQLNKSNRKVFGLVGFIVKEQPSLNCLNNLTYLILKSFNHLKTIIYRMFKIKLFSYSYYKNLNE